MTAAVLRAWLVSRSVVSVSAVCLALSVLGPVLMPLTPFLDLKLWMDRSGLQIALVTLLSAVAGTIGTIAMVPIAPEWERRRPARLRALHALTWLVCCIGMPSVGPFLSMPVVANDGRNAWALVTTTVAVVGTSAVCTSLLGRALGPLCALVIALLVFAYEQFSGSRWIFAGLDGGSGALVAIAAAATGAVAQGWTIGEPRWARRVRHVDA